MANRGHRRTAAADGRFYPATSPPDYNGSAAEKWHPSGLQILGTLRPSPI